MRILDTDIAAEYQKEFIRQFCMLELVFASTYRYNETEENIYDSSGNLFLPRSFTFDNINTSSGMAVAELDIVIDNTDQVISAVILNEDVRNRTVKLYIGAITQPTSGPSEIITQEFMRGIVGGWELSEDNKVKITIKNELVLWSKKALRIQSSSCPWAFKGTECAYAGAQTWCDQSYDRCRDLANTDHFGGFRFLPALMEKEIWWGRERSL